MASKQFSLFDFEDDASPRDTAGNTAPAQEAGVAKDQPEPEREPVEIHVEDLMHLAAEPGQQYNNDEQDAEEKRSTRGRQRISEYDADNINIPDDDVLFSKSYYGIGEVSKMFNANISQIRFWEKEFPILKPRKNGKGDRLFRPEDVKNLKLIYHLLRDRKYTIEGAREFLRTHKNAEERFKAIESLQQLKTFLTELKLSL